MNTKNTDCTCPYCSALIEPPPQRKRKCPTCGETVLVKKPCCDRNKEKRLMTEKQAALEEQKWQKHHGTDPESQAAKRALLLETIRTSKNPHQLKMAYHELSIIARKVGLDPMPFKRKVTECQILEYKAEPTFVAGLQVAISENDPRAGPQCDVFQGKVYSFDEALAEKQIPCGPDCICYWEVVFEDEI